MKILIRGTGDLATEIASGLSCKGHLVQTIEANVNSETSRKENGITEISSLYEADIIVEVVSGEENPRTEMDETPFVIGVGEGFVVGENCHCVIETRPGHVWGNVIWREGTDRESGISEPVHPGGIGSGFCDISDKTRAVSAGVQKAVEVYARLKGRYAVVVLAAGLSRRFGSNKLLETINGKPMYEHMLKNLKGFSGFSPVIVTSYEEIAQAAETRNIRVVINEKPEKGLSRSMQLGLGVCLENNPDLQGILFSVCDQPNLTFATMFSLLRRALNCEGKIICAGNERKKNPVLWDKKYFSELEKVEGDVGGRAVMVHYPDQIVVVETEERELTDIDFLIDMENGLC